MGTWRRTHPRHICTTICTTNVRSGDPYGCHFLHCCPFKGVILVRTATRRDFPDTPLTIDDEGYIWRNP